MTPREPDTDQLLGALGELHRAERSELSRLEKPAQDLAALEPERAQALEDRLMNELFSVEQVPLKAAASAQPASFKDLRVAIPTETPARSPRAWGLASVAAASVAMAAAALLWVRQPEARPFAVTYTLVAPSSDAEERSAAQPTRTGVYSLGRTLRFALRPAERYEGPLTVTCYAVQDDTVVALETQVELDPAGGARVVLPGDKLAQSVREGSWQLRFYVAPPSAATVTQTHVRMGQCPSDTRCLSFAARFSQP